MSNILCPGEYPNFLILSSDVPFILYYALIPGMLISLLLGFFVLYKRKNELDSKLLFLVSIAFFIWGFFALVLFATVESRSVIFFWSLTILIEPLIYILSLYLTYVFIYKKDISFLKKGILFLLLLPLIVLVPTKFNLLGVNVATCDAIEGPLALYYTYFLEIISSFWIIILSIIRYRTSNDYKEKNKIIYFAIGISIFLLTFSSGNIIGSFTSDWVSSQYGYFGMPIFMGFLAYIIVKYKAFNIKLIGAQALVIGLIILIGSQFLFIKNTASIVLTGITLVLVGGIGIALIRSVKLEVERKEMLQKMADSLAEANDQLRVLDNAKTEFISIASHQLRTPVTAIKGFSSLLMEGSYGEMSNTIRGAIEKIYVSSENLANLIEDLLNVSRIESGRMTFSFENANIGKMLSDLYENFLILAKSKKFYLDLKLPKDPIPEFKMDFNKVRELVSNFIDNALKYTEKGGVTISAEIRDEGVIIDDRGFVKTEEKSSYGKVVRITVSDTGIGIPKEEIHFLFRKFSRGKDVSRLHVSGTGLGLYVGKAIAEAHHGAVWVESDGPGMGSRFMIEIPINS
ncbi:MAG TPA: HAMP domain-containing sensor histidine kinase [Candidatus Moranbacteria bacterium]|nr:HAMP domain-containing sensor histidine kinase [Candidatus Moranbacteria bacterium]HRZ33311.1 HAMP domain-containing sensor histidine kinase [Candidatus Moranbacteria bacterium]